MWRFVSMAAVSGYLLTNVAYAQSAGCPTGFTMQPAQLGEQLADLNLDGQVCRSEEDVRPNGIVETTTLDNDAEPCGCPKPFAPLLFLTHRADRNDDETVCWKVVATGPRDSPDFKTIFIDNRKCK